MKLVTFRPHGTPLSLAGVLLGDRILALAPAFGWFEAKNGRPSTPAALAARFGDGVLGFVEHAQQARPVADELSALAASGTLDQARGPDGESLFHSLASVSLLAPIPRPPSMRDGYAFRQHVETARRNRGLEMIPEFDQFPVFYFTNHQSVIGPGELLVEQQHLDRLDFELEAAVVVGARAKNLSVAEADKVIFGMTIMNDFSARALQMEEMKLSLGPAKGKDFATGLGPVLVTIDELAAKSHSGPKGTSFDLEMKAFVNDVQVSHGNVKDMNWTFAEILARASYGAWLYPGDVIGSGTCGTGCFLELNGSKITNNQWLQPNDRVALEIDGLGRLDHRVHVGDGRSVIERGD